MFRLRGHGKNHGQLCGPLALCQALQELGTGGLGASYSHPRGLEQVPSLLQAAICSSLQDGTFKAVAFVSLSPGGGQGASLGKWGAVSQPGS